MWRLTLAQMRRSLGRLASAGIAIGIGTAFVATTLLAGGVMTRASYDSVTALFARSDLVADTANADQLAAIRAVDGVDAADPLVMTATELRHGAVRVWTYAVIAASDPRLEPQVLTAGALPSEAGQIALPAKTAERLKVEIGDEVVTQHSTGPTDPDSGTTESPSVTTATVVGLLDDPNGAYLEMGGAAIITADEAVAWSGVDAVADLDAEAVLIVLEPGTDVAAIHETIAAAVPGLEVMTKDDAAKEQIATISGGTDVFLGLVLSFAAVALVVAALVIANTFQVLVAQRTRTLALLRCVGADKAQLRRSVLLEAAILGGVASLVGLISGVVLGQVALSVLNSMSLDVPLPARVSVTAWVVLVPLVLGTAVTVLAALVPARAASRVTPITALRPADAPALSSRSSRVRLVLSALLTLGGLGGLVVGTPLASTEPMLGLGIAVLGGAVSFVGVLLGSVFWIPRVVALVGRLLGRTGTSARLAAANTLRNPHRTAATSTALLIGVTLVAMMSTGAASARSTLGNALDDEYPVDVMISAVPTNDGSLGALPDGVEPSLAAVDGIDTLVPIAASPARLGTRAGGSVEESGGGDGWVTLRAIEPKDARTVMRAATGSDGLADDTIVLPADIAETLGIVTGDMVPVEAFATFGYGDTPVTDGATTTLRAVVIAGAPTLVTPATLGRLVPDAPINELWVRLTDVVAAGDVVPDIQDALVESTVDITGAGIQRASMQQLIDTLLAVVVGLLAVAVVIALVGVANTLSLSVLERRRESATLRAIGLSRAQLRLMLAIEGMLIAGVGALLGALLGVMYGWAGASTMLTQIGEVSFVVPWRDLALVLVVALAAGLLASVLPGRSAARTPPVAALAVD